MKQRKARSWLILILAVLVAATLALTGCGSGNKAGSTDPGSTSSSGAYEEAPSYMDGQYEEEPSYADELTYDEEAPPDAEESEAEEEPVEESETAKEPAEEDADAKEPAEEAGAGKKPGGGAGDAAIDEDGWYYSKEDVALYIHTYGRLPDNFITKNEAKDLGWSGGSVEKYRKGAAIGGDRFGNYEKKLPKGRYKECDIDTKGKKERGAKRIIFDEEGNIYYTKDHYRSFEQLYDKDGAV